MSSSAKIRYAISLGCALVALLIPLLARAAVVVQGHVVDTRGNMVSGATVTLAGANRTIETLSHPGGSFAFVNVVEGEYELRARAAAGTAALHVVVAGAPVAVELHLTLQTLGRVVSVSSAPSLRSGGSTLISAAQLAHSPASNNLADVFVQLPSAARGSNGQIHINGDHGDINYSLDGVPLPQALNRVIGSEVDPSDVGYLDVIEGAYPAKYGGKFGAVVNIATVAGSGAHGGYVETSAGSRGDATLSLLHHSALGPRGGMTLSLRQARTRWALDPPVRDAAHDRGSTANQFVRVTLPAGVTDSWNFDLSHVAQTFQIPPDTANGTPANSDDVETQNDAFASASFHHAIGLDGALTVNAFGKASTFEDFPDPANDFAAAPGD
ncbi:MAG: TonB-dependent receptor, partial [Candidatus Eremiobacteraeota bacterium]|nr:TonB-dependent receptor [Candidatus Eremiobacteraeota bacterium]